MEQEQLLKEVNPLEAPGAINSQNNREQNLSPSQTHGHTGIPFRAHFNIT